MDIKSFRRETAAQWVSPGPEYGNLRFLCRPLGFDYIDAQNRRLRLAAREAGGEDRITSEQRAAINVEAMVETCLLDVRGLTDAGEAVTFDRFCAMMRAPEYGELASIAMTACGIAGRQRAADMEDAAGNSAGPSSAS